MQYALVIATCFRLNQNKPAPIHQQVVNLRVVSRLSVGALADEKSQIIDDKHFRVRLKRATQVIRNLLFTLPANECLSPGRAWFVKVLQDHQVVFYRDPVRSRISLIAASRRSSSASTTSLAAVLTATGMIRLNMLPCPTSLMS